MNVQSFSIQPFLLKLVLKLLITQIGADFLPVNIWYINGYFYTQIQISM